MMPAYSKQKRSGRSRRRGGDGESGVYLILFVLILGAFLAIGGIAVDGARLFVASLQLQKAADLAVLSALSYRIHQGPLAGTATAGQIAAFELLVEGEANRIATLNAQLAGEGFVAAPVSDYDYATETVTVPLEGDVDLLLMDIIPLDIIDQMASIEVPAESAGVLNPAFVSLMLDVSGSMLCPFEGATLPLGAPVPACPACISALGGCNAGISKMSQLIPAAQNFIMGFRDGYDRMALIPFATGSAIMPGRSLNDTFNAQAWSADIAGLTAQGMTNHSHALIEAFRDAAMSTDAQGDQILDNHTVSYVLFTDGAPTAARVFLKNPLAGQLGDTVGTIAPHTNDLGPNDYTFYRVEYQVSGSPIFYGPSALIRNDLTGAGSLPYNHVGPYPPGWSVIPDLNGLGVSVAVPACSAQQPDGSTNPTNNETNPTNITPSDMDGRLAASFGMCVSNLTLQEPWEATPDDFNSHISLTSNNQVNTPMYWAEIFYNSAIAAADVLRKHLGQLHIIGLGEPASMTPGSETHASGLVVPGDAPHPYDNAAPLLLDPYQNALDESSRHDVFLARLAYDPEMTAWNANTDFSDASLCNNSFGVNRCFDTGLMTLNELAVHPAIGEGRQGEYLPTNDIADLNRFFRRIRRSILMQLLPSS